MSRTRTPKKLALCQYQVARLEFWHGSWEQDHPDYITFASFSGDTEVHQLLERDPTAADVQWFLTALGVCSCMVRKLVKKHADKWEGWTIPEILPMYWWSGSREVSVKRFNLLASVWTVLTDDGREAHCVAAYLTGKLPQQHRNANAYGWNPRAGIIAFGEWQRQHYCPCPNKETVS